MTLGGRWGSIYSLPPQKSRWGDLSSDLSSKATGQVRWSSLEVGPRPALSGPPEKSGGAL
jgi:hypothetical protein